VHREHALDCHLAAELAHGEHRGDACAANLDHHALEGLDAFLVAFDDLVVDLDGVASAELRADPLRRFWNWMAWSVIDMFCVSPRNT
jgi:hypothetical protein